MKHVMCRHNMEITSGSHALYSVASWSWQALHPQFGKHCSRQYRFTLRDSEVTSLIWKNYESYLFKLEFCLGKRIIQIWSALILNQTADPSAVVPPKLPMSQFCHFSITFQTIRLILGLDIADPIHTRGSLLLLDFHFPGRVTSIW